MDVGGVAGANVGTDASLSDAVDDRSAGFPQPEESNDGPQPRNARYDPDRPIDPRAIEAIREALVDAGIIEPSKPTGVDSPVTLSGFERANPAFASPPSGLAGPPSGATDNAALSIAPSTPTDRLGGGLVPDLSGLQLSTAANNAGGETTQPIGGFTPRGGGTPIDGTFTPSAPIDPNQQNRNPTISPGIERGPLDNLIDLNERFKDTTFSGSITGNTPFGGGGITIGQDQNGDVQIDFGGNVFGVGGNTNGTASIAVPGANGKVTDDGVIGFDFNGTVPIAPGIVGLNVAGGVDKDLKTGDNAFNAGAGLKFGPPGLNFGFDLQFSDLPVPFVDTDGGSSTTPGGTDNTQTPNGFPNTPPPGTGAGAGITSLPGGFPNTPPPGAGTDAGVTSPPGNFPNTPPPGTATDSGTTSSPDNFPNSPPPGTGASTPTDTSPKEFPDTPPPGTKTDEPEPKPEPKAPKREGGESRGQQRDTTPSEDRDFGGPASDFGGSNGLL